MLESPNATFLQRWRKCALFVVYSTARTIIRALQQCHLHLKRFGGTDGGKIGFRLVADVVTHAVDGILTPSAPDFGKINALPLPK